MSTDSRLDVTVALLLFLCIRSLSLSHSSACRNAGLCHESQDEYFRQVQLLWKQDEVRKSPLQ